MFVCGYSLCTVLTVLCRRCEWRRHTASPPLHYRPRLIARCSSGPVASAWSRGTAHCHCKYEATVHEINMLPLPGASTRWTRWPDGWQSIRRMLHAAARTIFSSPPQSASYGATSEPLNDSAECFMACTVSSLSRRSRRWSLSLEQRRRCMMVMLSSCRPSRGCCASPSGRRAA